MNKRQAKKGNSARYQKIAKEYKRLASRADTRLLELEKLAKNPDYSNVLKWAYSNAMQDIKVWRGEGKRRFGQQTPANIQSLKAKLNDVKTFLDSPTSTKSGINRIFKQRAMKLNARYHTSFTWQEVGEFFEMKSYERYERQYGSDTTLKAIGFIRENNLKTIKDLKKLKESKIKMPDVKVQDAIEKLLKDRHKDVKNFKGGNIEN